MLVPVRRTRSALADTFTNLLRLDKDTMDHCAEDFPKLRKVIDAFTTKKLKEIIAASYAPIRHANQVSSAMLLVMC